MLDTSRREALLVGTVASAHIVAGTAMQQTAMLMGMPIAMHPLKWALWLLVLLAIGAASALAWTRRGLRAPLAVLVVWVLVSAGWTAGVDAAQPTQQFPTAFGFGLHFYFRHLETLAALLLAAGLLEAGARRARGALSVLDELAERA